MRLNEQQVYQWFDIFKNNKELVEIRLVGTNKTASGYFTDARTLIEAIKPYTDFCNVYFTLNPLNPSCYGREQKDKIVERPKNTTGDNEVISRQWILIDLDSKRISGVCATREEVKKAYTKGLEVFRFLVDNGFYEPIMVFSSSGIHLYLKCSLPNDKETTNLIKKFLESLSMIFSDEYVEVDTTVFNASRISRLMGSWSAKGAINDNERPQRQCQFLSVPQEIKKNKKEYFEKIANLLPKEEQIRPSSFNNYSTERFNLEDFIAKYNIPVTSKVQVADGTKYYLEHCLFNEQHRGKDAILFQRNNGAIAYFCYHNSCAGNDWRKVREMYEPDAYTRKYNDYQFNNQRVYKKEFVPIQENEEKGKLWLKMSDIKKPVLDIQDYIPSGIPQIDNLIIGFKRKHCSLWSGYRGSAKTSILNMFILNAAQNEYKTALWTGELDGSEVKQWLYLQAAGKSHNRKSNYNDYYYTPDNVCEDIDKWIDKYLWLFNNEYGENFKQIEDEIRKLKKEEDIDMVILDSLMVLDYEDLDGDRNEKQKNVMRLLTKLAKELNIHIHLVAHPNKSGTFLRTNNISGSGHIPDLAQNIFILHRLGLDFEKNASDFLSNKTINDIKSSQCTNVIEICKCRDKGSAVDKFIHLYFEIESNRLKNSIAEHIVYNWEYQEENNYHQPILEDTISMESGSNPFESNSNPFANFYQDPINYGEVAPY